MTDDSFRVIASVILVVSQLVPILEWNNNTLLGLSVGLCNICCVLFG
jgi:hypothetical protein